MKGGAGEKVASLVMGEEKNSALFPYFSFAASVFPIVPGFSGQLLFIWWS
jgi:hypothetical protein